MKLNLWFISIIILSFLLFSCGSEEEPINSPSPPISDPVNDPPAVTEGSGIGPARDISSFDLVAEMGVGWNHGNYFDVTSEDKTFWGNPVPTQAVIDDVRSMGFKTLRIPITWGYDQEASAPYTIEPSYLAQIKRVVDYGFKNSMHVIINVHHDEDWVKPLQSEADQTKERLGSLWTQVSEYFSEYNDSLIFETLNEPRLKGIPEEWNGGTVEGRALVNEYNKVALNAIRATGGNNSLRHIMIPSWAASTVPQAMNDVVVPNDDTKVIISHHTYFPWPFAGEAARGWGTDDDKAALENELERIRNHWIVERNRPVILGEWGTIERNAVDTRVTYADFYAREAASRELLTIVWDDGGMFRLYDRHSQSWDFPNIARAIVAASE